MFSTTITITHKLAVRDGYVEVPGSEVYAYAVPVDRAHMVALSDVLTLIPGSKVRREAHAPSRIHDQLWVELPAYDRSGSQTDWYATLRAAALTSTGYPK